jgi:hypothetical protein
MRTTCAIVISVAMAAAVQGRGAFAQLPGDRPGELVPGRPGSGSPRAAAVIDLTGYWVSIVTEDWRWRMITPERGDYSSGPLNPEGRHAADLWDPDKDTATGNQCKAYGVGGLMRIPGRLHITWPDDTTLKIETDAGTQTRLLHFNAAPSPAGDKSWQGYSVAEWQGRPQTADGPKGGTLKVVTTGMRPGYLRKNGVPYSQNAAINEYWHRTPKEMNGDEWLIVTTIVTDPKYLTQPFITSTHFKKEPDNSKWNPTPCGAR